MTETKTPEPEYSAPPLGSYPVEEHLRAQREQPRPDGSPMHESTDDEHDDPED